MLAYIVVFLYCIAYVVSSSRVEVLIVDETRVKWQEKSSRSIVFDSLVKNNKNSFCIQVRSFFYAAKHDAHWSSSAIITTNKSL